MIRTDDHTTDISLVNIFVFKKKKKHFPGRNNSPGKATEERGDFQRTEWMYSLSGRKDEKCKPEDDLSCQTVGEKERRRFWLEKAAEAQWTGSVS